MMGKRKGTTKINEVFRDGSDRAIDGDRGGRESLT